MVWKQVPLIKWSSPKQHESILLDLGLNVLQVAVSASLGKASHINKHSIREILHGTGHCLNYTPVERNMVVQLVCCLV